MKHLKLLMFALAVCAVIVLAAGCGRQGAGTQATAADSAPVKMLKTPDRAREVVQESNERAGAVQDAMDN